MAGSAYALVPQENLLLRPDPPGTPTKVLVAPYVIDIENINSAKQQFTIDLVLSLEWKDSRLAGRQRRLSLNEIWHPQAYLYNQRLVRKFLPDVVEISPDGTVLYMQRYYGHLASRLDLRDFPFDRQTLPITVVSFLYSPEQVNFVLDTRYTGRAENFSNTDWQIDSGKGSVRAHRTAATHDRAQQYRLARFDYVFTAKRHLSYYVWKVIGPLILIVLMSWAVFYIDPAQIGPQLGLAATSILTLIAFLFSLGNILPPISYLTRMDYFVYASLALVFLAFIEALASGFLAAHGKHELAKRFDRISRWVFPLAFAVFNVWFWG